MQAKSNIYIEPDGQYATISTQRDETLGIDVSISTPAGNQTLTVAFNKARDDLAALLVGGLVARHIQITLRAEP